jgi:hypothetical protein
MNQHYKHTSLIDNSTYLVRFNHQYGILKHKYNYGIKTKLKTRYNQKFIEKKNHFFS